LPAFESARELEEIYIRERNIERGREYPRENTHTSTYYKRETAYSFSPVLPAPLFPSQVPSFALCGLFIVLYATRWLNGLTVFTPYHDQLAG